ncbi:MAG TPA: hypothetical protein VGR03_11380, partial [Candidatus Acidoferrum sp.]|nr:hypothetical protein [Candidatus Acidoferrum sp.]
MKKTSAKPRKQKGSLRIADSASRIAKAIKEESTKARAVTPRQRTVLANLRKGMSQYKAIRGAGYSEATARHPGELLRGKALGLAFEKLMPSIEELASGIR